MSWKIDAEVGEVLAPLLAAMAEVTPPPVGEIEARRKGVEGMLARVFGAFPVVDDVETRDCGAVSSDGYEVPMRLYTKAGSRGGGLVVYAHGGGMIMGSVELYDPLARSLVSRSGVAVLSVDYRVAPEHPHPTPVEDCYAAVQWASKHAAELGCDPARIAIAGDSGGGGLAAATALLARDRGGPALARQILIYPMLDDRNTSAPDVVPDVLMWSYDDNATGWGALLGDAMGTDEVSPYAAPARASDLSGLPPTYLIVGDMDIFRDEDMAYAARLTRAGVPVEFQLIPGAPHAFDFLAPNTTIGRRAYSDEIRAFRSV
ncbi:MAG TPA: alpha/beta hydrolase [Pseudonocardia sp.]|nr:alpha/beta hydrolase [Pseudonocardia sp.]